MRGRLQVEKRNGKRNPCRFRMTKGYSSNSVPRGTDDRAPLKLITFRYRRKYLRSLSWPRWRIRQYGTVRHGCVPRAPGAFSSGRDVAASTLYLRISSLRLGTSRDFIYSQPHGKRVASNLGRSRALECSSPRRVSLRENSSLPFSFPLSPPSAHPLLPPAFGDSPEVLEFGTWLIRCVIYSQSRLTSNCVRWWRTKRGAVFILSCDIYLALNVIVETVFPIGTLLNFILLIIDSQVFSVRSFLPCLIRELLEERRNSPISFFRNNWINVYVA